MPVKLLPAVLLLTLPAFGQTTFATLTGTVTDPGGAVVPNANLTATHVDSNYQYTATSNDSGNYTISQLREGIYILRVQAPGFKESRVQNISLVSLDVRRVNITLEIGAVDTKVEVSATASLIETETARISDAKGSDALKTLPMNTRSLWNFVGLSPGVVQAGGGSSTRRFAGSRANQSDASVDGITISNNIDGTQVSPLVSYIESFEEVRVDMANNTSEFGSIGQVTIVSKSGSNQLHGSLFDYYTTPWFRARNPFAATRSTGIRHNPGGSAGGPVVIPKLYDGHNKTFFFFSYETSRGSAVQQLLNPTVPLASWRAGDFSNTSAIRDPFASNAPFPGNRLPANRISPVAQRIQERFYPLPNVGDPNTLISQNYREQITRPFDPDLYWTTRIDHRFSQKAFVFGRYTWNNSYSRGYEGNLPTIGPLWQIRDTRAFNVSYTHTFRSNLINEFRFGFAYNDQPRNGAVNGNEMAKQLGLQGLAPNLPDITGILKLTFSNLSLTGLTQTDWRHPGFKNYPRQFQEQLSWFRGRHNIKAGGQFSFVRFEDNQAPANLFGSVNFSNRFTNHPYADFLLGIPTTAARAFPQAYINRTRPSYDFFLTDDFKVSQKLTINAGIRYELHPAWTETNGLQSIFDVGSGQIVVPDGALGKVSPIFPKGYVNVVEAKTLGLPGGTLIKTDKNNWAPRIGLAYRPFGNNTVIRAGIGIFYDIVPRSVSNGGAPFTVAEPSFTNPTPIPTLLFPQVFPATAGNPTTVSLPGAVRTDLRMPYSMQYNFTIEHQRWNTGFRASYIGTNTRQGEWGYNINQPIADNRLFVDKPRLFPNYPVITYTSNGAGHQYNSLTLEAERRFLRGFSYQLSWVYARDIGDLERGESPEDAYNRQREKAVWLDIPTHRVTGSIIYELPFGPGKKYFNRTNRLARTIAGGWELSVIYSSYSGQFLTPIWTGPDPTGTAYSTSRTPAQVSIRPDALRDANLSGSDRSVNRWFDAAAFAAPAAGRFGTSAKGVIKGPGSAIVNTGFFKRIEITERVRVRLELTSTNFFNHPNWDNPNVTVTAAVGVGVITGVGGPSVLDSSVARSFRSGIRLEW
ncbi:MAG: carboxypeptidase regulatory-like domain-containing protein [Acidobacteria bacterium]|nr:carboxypeptidase regulatory-like domain-containing protein [Acidobacteriota bacterium]